MPSPFPAPLADLDPRYFLDTLEEWGRILVSRLPHIAAGVVIVLLAWFLSGFARRMVVAAGSRSRLDMALALLLGRIMSIIVFVVGLGIAAVVILPSFRPVDLIAGLGISSIAIGFALKDVLQNFFAGILLLWQKPFRVGDQVKIKDFEGTVEDITIRSTQLLTYDGERVVLPNGDVYISPIVVRTAYDKRRVSVKVGIKSAGDLEPAREAVRRAAAGTSGVLPEPAPEVHTESLAPGAVTLAVAYWVKPDNATVVAVNDAVFTAIKQALDAAGIALA
jgi:small conductance mechanosensitive channel